MRLLFLHGAGMGPADTPVARLEAALGPMAAPDLGEPDAAVWAERIVAALAELPEDAAVIGHSLGGSMLVKAVAERLPGRRLAAFVGLGCPYWGGGGWQGDSFRTPDGLTAGLAGIERIAFLMDPADEVVEGGHLALWQRAVPRAATGWTPGTGHGYAQGDLAPVLAAVRG